MLNNASLNIVGNIALIKIFLVLPALEISEGWNPTRKEHYTLLSPPSSTNVFSQIGGCKQEINNQQ